MQNLNEFSNRDNLDDALANKVASLLANAISSKGQASLAVSGGSTPKGFFLALSQFDLAWDKVTITLADERWVKESSDASNTALVKSNLLINNASKASFFELKRDGDLAPSVIDTLNSEAKQKIFPLDVLILGMGEDGHTASIFPCSNQIDDALNLDNNNVFIKVLPQTAPHERISFTYKALIQTKNIFLHVCGENKKSVLNVANAGDVESEMPIRAFLNHPERNIDIYWAE